MKKALLPIGAVQERISGLPLIQKLMLFVGTFVVLIGAFYYFIYSDQVATIARLDGSIADQQKRLSQLKQAAAQTDALQKDLAASEKEFAELLGFLPDQKEIPAILDNISQLGARVGLENILFQPQGEVPKEFYATIPIRLDLVGTYQQVGTFLDNLSKMHRILKVDSLTLSRTPENSVLKVGCTILTYRFIESPPPGGAPPAKK